MVKVTLEVKVIRLGANCAVNGMMALMSINQWKGAL